MFALISFCNQGKRISSLALVNLESFQVSFIPLLLPHNSITGLCQDRDYIFVATQNGYGNSINVFSKSNLSLISHSLFKYIDIHSLHISNKQILANDTSTDSIIEVTWDPELKKLSDPKIVIKGKDNEDSLHVNSVITENGNILISMFGSGLKENYATKNSGKIKNLTTGKTLFTGLNHPHSLRKYQDSYYYCESITRKIYKDDKPIIQHNEGYLRGLDLNDVYIVAGLSKGREISKSTGTKRSFKEQALNKEVCALLVYDQKSKRLIKKLDFWPEYTEIYDCLIIDNLELTKSDKKLETELILNQSRYLWDIASISKSQITEQSNEIIKLYEEIANLSNLLTKESQNREEISKRLIGLEQSRWLKIHKLLRKKS